MNAWKIAAGISCCLILTAGCSICQHPNYNCGPVWSPDACQNCDLDYRAGSILNRRGRGVPAAGDAPIASKPAPRGEHEAEVAARESDESDSQDEATTVDPEQRTPKRAATVDVEQGTPKHSADVDTEEPAPTPAPVERQAEQSPPTREILPEAPGPNDLPVGKVDAPPGTKEGETRIVSVSDRRLDDVNKSPKPVAAQRNSPQPTSKQPGDDSDGWRPAANHQDPLETATQPREIVR